MGTTLLVLVMGETRALVPIRIGGMIVYLNVRAVVLVFRSNVAALHVAVSDEANSQARFGVVEITIQDQ